MLARGSRDACHEVRSDESPNDKGALAGGYHRALLGVTVKVYWDQDNWHLTQVAHCICREEEDLSLNILVKEGQVLEHLKFSNGEFFRLIKISESKGLGTRPM